MISDIYITIRITAIILPKVYILGVNTIQSLPNGPVFYRGFPDPTITDYVGHCWKSSQFLLSFNNYIRALYIIIRALLSKSNTLLSNKILIPFKYPINLHVIHDSHKADFIPIFRKWGKDVI